MVIERKDEWLQIARLVLEAEASAITEVAARLNSDFTRAVEIILTHPGKVIVTGVGKSGNVAQKIAATLSSTGTPAIFLHASDAFHGDLGLYQPGDPTILISKNGTTQEMLKLIPILRDFHSPLIGIIGNLNSPLAAQMDVVLDAAVSSEADLHNLAPTTSTTVSLALGDALACTLIQARGFTAEDFARYHPGGQLGRNLRLRVDEVAHLADQVAWVHPDAPLKQVVIAMTKYPLGAACVVDDAHHLVGLITDGDLRRALLEHDDIRLLRASDVMTHHPIIVAASATCRDALALMENRPFQLSVLPVVDLDSQICLGLIRIHDIYQESGV